MRLWKDSSNQSEFRAEHDMYTFGANGTLVGSHASQEIALPVSLHCDDKCKSQQQTESS